VTLSVPIFSAISSHGQRLIKKQHGKFKICGFSQSILTQCLIQWREGWPLNAATQHIDCRSYVFHHLLAASSTCFAQKMSPSVVLFIKWIGPNLHTCKPSHKSISNEKLHRVQKETPTHVFFYISVENV